ncbi:hypothetical protein ABIB44_003121 [Hymenobacter sp. UYCo722]
MTFRMSTSQSPVKFAFSESSLTLQMQTPRTMLQTRYYFGFYYFYAAA